MRLATHPELNRIAIAKHLDASYMLWVVLRDNAILSNLSTHYTRELAYCTALKYGITYTRHSFNRILMQGTGIFWGNDAKNIYLRSFQRVYKLLADEQASRVSQSMFVLINPEKSAVSRRAELYWSWFAGRGEQTIARDTIKDLFNLSHDQQRDYEKHLGTRLLVKSNYCHIDIDLYPDAVNHIPEHSYHFLQEKFNENTVNYVNVIAYQMPNTYIACENECDGSSTVFAPKRALYASRTLYRHTLACGYNERCYFNFYDEWEKNMSDNAYIRTFYQGRKRIHRASPFF
jgi:hypothetical protein